MAGSRQSASLSVIIVNYNAGSLLSACVRSVVAAWPAGTGGEILVVDNASTDGSGERAAAEYGQVRLVRLETNRGFGAALNHGLALAPAEFVLLLNPDTELRPGAIDRMLDTLTEFPNAGLVGPRLVYPDGRPQHSAFRFPDLVQVAVDLFPDLLGRLYDSPLNGRYPAAAYEGRRPFRADFVLGACMLGRYRALADVGFFDEQFFMYCEEVDLAFRLRRAGWEILCEPRAVVVHHGGASTGQVRTEALRWLWQSRFRLFDRYYPPYFRTVARLMVRLAARRRGPGGPNAEAWAELLRAVG